jgi:hypothetical protein
MCMLDMIFMVDAGGVRQGRSDYATAWDSLRASPWRR